MVGCGEMIGIGRRRPVTERRMRPRRVVVSDPGSDDSPSLDRSRAIGIPKPLRHDPLQVEPEHPPNAVGSAYSDYGQLSYSGSVSGPLSVSDPITDFVDTLRLGAMDTTED